MGERTKEDLPTMNGTDNRVSLDHKGGFANVDVGTTATDSVQLTEPAVAFCMNRSVQRTVEIVVLSVVIVLVWGVLSLPVVFYHVTDSTESDSRQVSIVNPYCMSKLWYSFRCGFCTSTNCLCEWGRIVSFSLKRRNLMTANLAQSFFFGDSLCSF